jgi:AcrR family transcriptional regulator
MAVPVRSEQSPQGRGAGPGTVAQMTWAERVAERSPSVRRSRDRSVEQARSIVAAARRLIEAKGPSFTTQELIKEAGIALQTFYRYFSGKDYLLLAVIEDIIDESCAMFRQQASDLADPLSRLRFYVTATVQALESRHGPSFMTSEHFRLQTLYPAEVSRATQPYTDLVVEEIRIATAQGRVFPHDPEYSAWLITQLSMAVFHHYDCAGLTESPEQVADRLWAFCFAALNGEAAQPQAGSMENSPARARRTESAVDRVGRGDRNREVRSDR